MPFDLKVTYLPEEYLMGKRKEAGKRPEVTLLKQTAKQNGLPIDDSLAKAALVQDLWFKVSDHPAPACKALIAELIAFRNELVARIQENPDDPFDGFTNTKASDASMRQIGCTWFWSISGITSIPGSSRGPRL